MSSMAERARVRSEARTQVCKICYLIEEYPDQADEIIEMVDDHSILPSAIRDVLQDEFGIAPSRSSVKPHREGRCAGVAGR